MVVWGKKQKYLVSRAGRHTSIILLREVAYLVWQYTKIKKEEFYFLGLFQTLKIG